MIYPWQQGTLRCPNTRTWDPHSSVDSLVWSRLETSDESLGRGPRSPVIFQRLGFLMLVNSYCLVIPYKRNPIKNTRLGLVVGHTFLETWQSNPYCRFSMLHHPASWNESWIFSKVQGTHRCQKKMHAWKWDQVHGDLIQIQVQGSLKSHWAGEVVQKMCHQRIHSVKRTLFTYGWSPRIHSVQTACWKYEPYALKVLDP